MEKNINRDVIITRVNKLDLGDSLPKNIGVPQSEKITTPEQNERGYTLKILEFTNWKTSGEREAAKLLGIKRTTLESRMKKLTPLCPPLQRGELKGGCQHSGNLPIFRQNTYIILN